MAVGPRPGDMAATYAALQSLVLNAQSVEDFLTDLARLSSAITEPRASCGITARYGSRPLTVASSDARAERVDESQYVVGEGPCLDALRTGTPIAVRDMAADTRWEEYRERAVEQGLKSSLSMPLIVDGSPTGALNLYSFDLVDAFSGAQTRRAEVFAAQASTALTLMTRQLQQRETAEQLEQALASRTTIDHAIGIIMGQQRCSADEAFALLRRHSQSNNRKLREVAADIVTQVSGQPPVEGPAFRHGRRDS